MKVKKVAFWAVVILIAGAALRLVNLNSLPIFADESIYVRWSQVMRAEATLRFLPLSDGKQPFFMWATIPFLKVVRDPLLAGRTLAALSGLGTMAGVGFATWLLFKNQRLALISSGLAALLPYLIFFDRMALVDSLLACFLVWAFNLSLWSLQKARLDLAMLAGFALGFAWLTKSPAVFALLLLTGGLLFAKNKLKGILLLGVTYMIGFGMYNILRLGPEFAMIAIRNKDYLYTISEIMRHPLDPLKPHLRDSFQFYWYLTTPLGVAAGVWGLIVGKGKYLAQKIVLLAWVAIPIFAESLLAKQFTARYLLFTVPFAVILMGLAVEAVMARLKHWWPLALMLMVFTAADLTLIFAPQKLPLPRIERAGYLEEWTSGYGIAEVADYIKNVPGPVVLGSEGYFGTPFDGLQLYLNSYRNVRVVGVGVWIESIPEKLVNATGDNTVFLVVNSSRLHVDPDSIGLKLIAKYPKAVPPLGEQESLLFFEVPRP